MTTTTKLQAEPGLKTVELVWCELVLHFAGAEEVEAAEEVDVAAEVEAAKEVEAAEDVEDVEAAVAEGDAAAAEFEVDAGVSQELAGILA